MTTAIAIEGVRREVKMLRTLTGHENLVQFYEAYEDEDNVYVVMELCKGGELLDRILSRGGKYPEEDAKIIMVQILNVVAYCHLQGVVHRDLKPEMKGLMILLEVLTMWHLKSCTDHMEQRLICGVLVSLLIYFFAEADLSGGGWNLEYSELF